VTDYLGDHPGVLFVFDPQVVLELIWIKTFSHQDIRYRVDIGITLSSDSFSDVLDVDLVPVLLFVYVSKCRPEQSDFDAFKHLGQVVRPRDQP
jgi:hypothetical protein